MAAINTPVSATATNTQAEDTVQNPTAVNTAPETKVVHVSLIFKGVDWDPNVLYDGLNTAYGTVASTKDSVARGTYIFTIEA